MKLQISTDAVCAFAGLAISARVVCGTLIDMPELLNAGWIAAILGALFALPPMIAVRCCKQNSVQPSKLICGVFCAIAICDAAVASSSIADSASYMALNTTPAVYLMFPQLALCLFCLRLNGDALGTSAGIWRRILPWLLLIVIFLQAKDYRPEWLTPILGPGIPTILSGALRIAGWFTLPVGLYLIAEPGIAGKPSLLRPLKTLGISSGFAILICLIFSMTTPAITDSNLYTRAFRLDALLANGRTGLAQQLPSIALWYLGLFYALLFDLFIAVAMLQRIRPDWNRHTCIWITLIVTGILGADSLSGRTASLLLADWLYPAQSILLAITMIIPLLKKKGADSHA